jgi:putative Mn2+ efflux pump MntP
MTLAAVFALAVALAVDAFAVAVALAVHAGAVTRGQAFRLSFSFGLFQFLMPVIGWFLGLTVRGLIERWDHWAAFGLLALIGLNMARESFAPEKGEDAGNSPRGDPTRGLSLLLLSVATSIDALAVGLSFALLQTSVWFPAAVIGVVCCAVTLLGLFMGRPLARAALFGKRAGLIGGLTLLGIGVKILHEHGVFANMPPAP